MKKLFSILTILIVVATLFVATSFGVTSTAFADTNYMSTETYRILQDFITANPIRSGQVYELNTANYILGKFDSYGLQRVDGGLQTVQFYVDDSSLTVSTTYNAISILDDPNAEDFIVIGAHYDASGTSEGANDNASGITALLQIAKQLATKSNLGVDVLFVAFGGEEQGLYGSQHFVDNFSRQFTKPLTSIRLMINLDSIANGDNLYLHCEDKNTDIANLFLQNHTGNSPLKQKPFAVGTYAFDMWGYGYYQTVQGSDHTPFRLAGIPVANFFSGNFQTWDFVESKDASKNTMNTANDTLLNLDVNRGAEWVSKIDTVVGTVVGTVASEQFDAVSKNARSQLVNNELWHNSLWAKLIGAVIIIVAVVFAIFHFKKLQKQSIMGTAEIKNTRVFETPDANDIFTFKD